MRGDIGGSPRMAYTIPGRIPIHAFAFHRADNFVPHAREDLPSNLESRVTGTLAQVDRSLGANGFGKVMYFARNGGRH